MEGDDNDLQPVLACAVLSHVSVSVYLASVVELRTVLSRIRCSAPSCYRSGSAYLILVWYTFREMLCFPKNARSDDAATEQFMGEARRRHRLAPAAARQTRAGAGHMPHVANSESHIHLNVEMATLTNSRRLPHACTALCRLALLSKNRAGLRSWQHQTLQA